MTNGDIYHNSHNSFYKHPFGAVPTCADVMFRLAARKSANIQTVVLRLWSDEDEILLPLDLATTNDCPAAGDAGLFAKREKFTATSKNFRTVSDSETVADDSHSTIGDNITAFGDSTTATGDSATAAGDYSNATDSNFDDVATDGNCDYVTAGSNLDYTVACGSIDRSASGGCSDCDASDDCIGNADYAIYHTTYNTGDKPRLIWYYFILENTAGKKSYYGNNPEMLGGVGLETPQPPWSYQLTVYDKAFHVPDWLRQGIIYQIFPDRFFQKRPAPLTQEGIELKRPDYILHTDWNDKPIYKPDPRTGEIMNNDFFGGNLAGIAEKLPYLKELGVSIIYLNPIFEAYSNHRYDTGNYRRIDALLGANSDFASLCVQARKSGIRIILDGVFNHTGSDSLYFNKEGFYRNAGAYQSLDSIYYNWYMFDEYPDKYECWWGVETLPHTNESDPDFIKYIISGDDSVVKHWLKQGASGWRLDVVDELPGEFVKDLRTHIKKTDPDAAIIGEVWEDASNKVSYGKRREYLLGFELDSVMNYVFKDALIAFMLGDINASLFNAKIMKLAENYPKECYYSLMNIIGGHDVKRILTILSEPPDDLTRDQKALHKPTLQKFRLGVKRLKLASLIQMTFPGAPCVYYGDEAGMAGFEDPFNRGAYPWDDINSEILEWYRSIISLRNSCPALRTGDFTTLLADESVYVYVRHIKDGADVFGSPALDGFTLIAINRDKENAANIDIDLSGWDIPALYDALRAGYADVCGGYESDGIEAIDDRVVDTAGGGSAGGGSSMESDKDTNANAGIITSPLYQNYTSRRLSMALKPLGYLVLMYQA